MASHYAARHDTRAVFVPTHSMDVQAHVFVLIAVLPMYNRSSSASNQRSDMQNMQGIQPILWSSAIAPDICAAGVALARTPIPARTHAYVPVGLLVDHAGTHAV
jgi:hypothetical protein